MRKQEPIFIAVVFSDGAKKKTKKKPMNREEGTGGHLGDEGSGTKSRETELTWERERQLNTTEGTSQLRDHFAATTQDCHQLSSAAELLICRGSSHVWEKNFRIQEAGS